MNKKIISALLSVLLILIGIAILIAIPEYKFRYSPAVLTDTTVKIYPNTTISELALSFEKGGIIENATKMIDFHATKLPQTIKAGNYKLTKAMSYRTLLNRIIYGNQTPVRLTFNNVRTLEQLAGRISRNTMADSLEFLKYFDSDSVETLTNLNRAQLPSLFLPNTYEIYWTITPAELTAKMKQEHQKFWNDTRKAKAQKLGFTPLQISSIAAIVAEETNVWDEMTNVAGVYINRLRANMPLQADPTVKFAIGDFTIKRVLNKHLETDSPYNTYKYSGLPPGPIRIVDGRVIDKVLDYEGHKYYYFCAKADFSGRHAFAENLSAHNRNAEAYRAELNRRKIR